MEKTLVVLPTFLIPGAPKAGSTTLYRSFDAHPQVLMSTAKEPAFFSAHWEKGLPYYEQFFAGFTDELAVGEATVEYMVDPRTPARIHQVLPRVRMIFTLREPVSRAVSHYWWRVSRKKETRTLDEVLSSADNYPVEFGRYHTQLCRFREFFPLEQMHFVLLDDMAADLERVIRDAFEFIGVDPEFRVEDAQAWNQTMGPKSRTAADLITRTSTVGLKRFAPRPVRSFMGRAMDALYRANSKPFQPPPLRPEQERRLREALQPEIEGLERLLGRDLSAWKKRA